MRYSLSISWLASLTNVSFNRDQILSDVLPFGKRRESLIAFEIVSGERPPRPSNPTAECWLPDPIWDVIQSCWHQAPRSRLSVDLLHHAFVGSEPERRRDVPVTEDSGGKHLVRFAGGDDFKTHFQIQRRRTPAPQRTHPLNHHSLGKKIRYRVCNLRQSPPAST